MTVRLFTNARLVCPVAGVSQGGLLVRDGRIAEIGKVAAPSDAYTTDLAGATLAPGIVDIGVFAVDRAAFRAGGITRAATMPGVSGERDDDALSLHRIVPGLVGEDLFEMAAAKRRGAVAVSTGRSWIGDSGLMRRVMAYAAALDLPIVSHAEDAGLVGDAVATDGATATRLGLASAPAAAETMAVMRDLFLSEVTGARLHFRQVTTAGALDIIRAAKKGGAPVTCGITPAHLFLSDIAVEDFRTFAKLSPPLRSEADRQACLRAVADGTIDLICSGHDPKGPEDKRLPFAEAEAGASGAETLLALSLGLVRDGLITVDRLFALLAANPAKLIGVRAGTLEPGMPADLIVIDEGAPWRIDALRMQARAGNTPFDGLPTQGKVLQLMVGGKLVA
ncbi:dihydroorotase [Sphingomonas gilva]|uniref:Dihydroorotase n=1 Tax=Sphingomonas gilva TaxID=2305907 RepID=A0A396RLN0_9SPHN|nr:amidohydrolase family protein [Sphingomonas gilva]RHW17099.1 dihydroorotase [Sphingomonas gilva]